MLQSVQLTCFDGATSTDAEDSHRVSDAVVIDNLGCASHGELSTRQLLLAKLLLLHLVGHLVRGGRCRVGTLRVTVSVERVAALTVLGGDLLLLVRSSTVLE